MGIVWTGTVIVLIWVPVVLPVVRHVFVIRGPVISGPVSHVIATIHRAWEHASRAEKTDQSSRMRRAGNRASDKNSACDIGTPASALGRHRSHRGNRQTPCACRRRCKFEIPNTPCAHTRPAKCAADDGGGGGGNQ